MSIKLMSQVWDKDLGHSEQSILLAMADYADDEGRNCYPSYARLAWKTGYSTRQVGRIITDLVTKGIVVILKPSNQHQSAHYWLRLDKAAAKEPFRVDISDNDSRVDILDTDSSIDKLSTLDDDDDSRVDICDTDDAQGGQMRHPGWTNETSRVDTMSTDPLVNHHIEPTEEEEEETHAHDPLLVAWQQAYTGVDMPTKLAASLRELVSECGMAATIHGIKASAVKEGGRNFRYIAECARNYVPPAPMASYANGNPYTIDIPGIVELPATKQTAPVLPTPMAHDDPWTIALAELSAVLPGSAPRWLAGSSLKENGELAGVPFYRVTLVCPEADPGWLRQQAEPAIRKKLASLLGKRIALEIVNPHKEYAA